MNKIILAGHLGADPSLRDSAKGDKYCHFHLATDEFWRDAKGERQKRTEWHSVFFWGPQAETLAKYSHKGSKVLVEGRLESRADPEAAGASPHRIWSVRGFHYEFLDRRPDAAPEHLPAAEEGEESAFSVAPEDDVPL